MQTARTGLLAIALVFVAASAKGGAEPNTNLTQLDAPGVLSDGWAPTSDSTHAVFVSSFSGEQEIYIVRLDEPGQILRLSRNGELGGEQDILSFVVSEDSQHVVYLVRTPGVLEDSERLLTVPTDGSTTPDTLSTVDLGTLGFGGIAFEVSPTSEHVVYTETTETAEPPFSATTLFSRLITGGSVSTLHPASLSISFQISRDGTRVVYLVGSILESSKIFSVPTGGGSSTQLNDDEDVPALLGVGPNSQRVVFTAINQQSLAQTLQSAPIDGGGQTILATAGANNAINLFVISNDTGSPRAVFVESGEQSRLASVPIAGGSVENLTDGFIDGGISPIRISPDGQRVVFQVTEVIQASAEASPQGVAESRSELFSVSVDGLSPGANPSTFSKGSADNATFSFHPSFDSTRLIYGAIAADDSGGDFPGTQELLSADITGGSAETLAGPLSGNKRVSFFFPFFDSLNVFYLADQEQDDVQELFVVPIDGGEFTKINDPLPPGGDVTSAFPTPDSSSLIYNADQVANDLFDLFLAPLGEPPQVIFSNGFEE